MLVGFDHLVGAGEQRRLDIQTKWYGGGQIDDHVERDRFPQPEWRPASSPAKNLGIDLSAIKGTRFVALLSKLITQT
jgi:hypothetical protein